MALSFDQLTDRRQLQPTFASHLEKLCFTFWRDGHQQTAAGLRIAEQRLLCIGQRRDFLASVMAPTFSP